MMKTPLARRENLNDEKGDCSSLLFMGGDKEKVYYKINNLQTIKILKNYGFS